MSWWVAFQLIKYSGSELPRTVTFWLLWQIRETFCRQYCCYLLEFGIHLGRMICNLCAILSGKLLGACNFWGSKQDVIWDVLSYLHFCRDDVEIMSLRLWWEKIGWNWTQQDGAIVCISGFSASDDSGWGCSSPKGSDLYLEYFWTHSSCWMSRQKSQLFLVLQL